MNEAVPRVERFVRERRETNAPFVSWPLYFFLLSWITLGIYGIILFYKRVKRADDFAKRKQGYYEALIAYARQRSQETGTADTLMPQISDVESETKAAFTSQFRPMNPGLSLLLAFLTLGLWGLYVIYRLDKFWVNIQNFEQDFDEKLSQILVKDGVLKHPITYSPDRSVERSFGLYLFLTVITFGIWGIVWDYKIHTDPERLFREFDTAEDSVLNAIRTAG